MKIDTDPRGWDYELKHRNVLVWENSNGSVKRSEYGQSKGLRGFFLGNNRYSERSSVPATPVNKSSPGYRHCMIDETYEPNFSVYVNTISCIEDAPSLVWQMKEGRVLLVFCESVPKPEMHSVIGFTFGLATAFDYYVERVAHSTYIHWPTHIELADWRRAGIGEIRYPRKS